VKHEPEKRTFTNFEMGPDGKIIDKGKTIIVDLSYLKKTFGESWGKHMEAREDAQKKGEKDMLRAALEMGSQLVYSHVEQMKNQPGCKTDDVDPLLAKGGGAVTLLITQFGSDVNDNNSWQEMLRFAKICKGVGSRTAYDVLAAMVGHASNIAPENRLDTLGYVYEMLGEIALMQGRFEEALAHLNKGLEYHKQVNPNYLTDKGRAELPSLDQLKRMLDKMTG
jgi:tetratricopeptide (TPR) repeat protein